MRILLTNDDGIRAPGLAALHRAAAALGELHVVAPSKARSACGHAVTFHRPIEVRPEVVRDESGSEPFAGHAVGGTPADCVKVGLARLVPAPVDLVLSGINTGCNVGVHTIYSGTVAAAREGAIAGVAAIAVSLHIGRRDAIRWQRATEIAAEVLAALLAEPLRAGALLNVNIPILDDGAEPRGVRVVPASPGAMIDDYRGEADADGGMELTVGGHVRFREVPTGSKTRARRPGPPATKCAPWIAWSQPAVSTTRSGSRPSAAAKARRAST